MVAAIISSVFYYEKVIKNRTTIAVIDITKPKGTLKWARKCGFHAVWIKDVPENFNRCDGLIVPGGDDITPSLYGQEREEKTYGCNLERDKAQIRTVLAFAQHNKPILGICRGCQLINVAYGGTLEQTIPKGHTKFRKIRNKKGSFAYSILGDTSKVWHYHHQCVQKLGKDLEAVSWDAKDGRIEAIESTKYPIYGLQWHPEGSKKKGEQVASKFVDLCAKNSGKNSAQKST